MPSQRTGPAASCVRHLLKDPSKTLIRTVAHFCGVTTQTVRRWAARGTMPIGLPLLKLHHLLEAAGFEVAEHGHMKPFVVAFGQLLAFDLMTIGEAAKLLDLEESSTYRIMLGKSDTQDCRRASMESAVSERRVALADRQAALVAQFKRPRAVSLVSSTAHPIAPKTAPSGTQDDAVSLLASHIRAMLPLAESVVSDMFSSEDRERLRHLAGDDGSAVFKLKNALVGLCGERARESIEKTKS